MLVGGMPLTVHGNDFLMMSLVVASCAMRTTPLPLSYKLIQTPNTKNSAPHHLIYRLALTNIPF